jgi:transposase
MYVATVPNRHSPPAILLRESYRDNGKVKSRTLANLTSWSPARLEALRQFLRGPLHHATASEPTLGPVFGPLYALKQIADALGITAALGHTRLAKLGLFLILARLAHQGSRLSAARWAQDHAVSETLGLRSFDEDDLYVALDDLCARQGKIEQQLFQTYLRRKGAPPRLFLYDVTSSYLEGASNALGEFGYNRGGKKAKLQIVVGLLTDAEGEPLAVRVFKGDTADPATVAKQIKVMKERCRVQELVWVGDRGTAKCKGHQALQEANLRSITALTEPQIRTLLCTKVLQLGLFSEQICEVEGNGVRYVLRKNQSEAARERHHLDDKLEKLEVKIAAGNEEIQKKPRCQPGAGQRRLQAWAERHKLTGLVELKLEGRTLVLERQEAAIEMSLQLAGCYAVTTNVLKQQMSAQEVHSSYVSLQRVGRDFRAMKTGLLELRPEILHKESRTRGHVFCCMLALQLSREMERRLQESFGTTDSNPHAITLPDALAALSSLALLQYAVDEKTTVMKLPQPTANQKQILAALGVSLPATK